VKCESRWNQNNWTLSSEKTKMFYDNCRYQRFLIGLIEKKLVMWGKFDGDEVDEVEFETLSRAGVDSWLLEVVLMGLM
jgi:hypothetical protein